MELLETTLREDAENLLRNDVKVVVMGDLSRVKPSLRLAVEETVEMTKDNQGVVLNVALSYGGRQDIVNAAKDMAEAVKFVEEEMSAGRFRRLEPRMLLLAVYSAVVGVATEPEVMRALGVEPDLRSLVRARRETIEFLRAALVAD